MLKIYFSSILIWMIIIFGITYICKDLFKKRGWIDESKKSDRNWILVLFFISSIPILRLLIAACILYMATISKEDYQKLKKEFDKDE